MPSCSLKITLDLMRGLKCGGVCQAGVIFRTQTPVFVGLLVHLQFWNSFQSRAQVSHPSCDREGEGPGDALASGHALSLGVSNNRRYPRTDQRSSASRSTNHISYRPLLILILILLIHEELTTRSNQLIPDQTTPWSNQIQTNHAQIRPVLTRLDQTTIDQIRPDITK